MEAFYWQQSHFSQVAEEEIQADMIICTDHLFLRNPMDYYMFSPYAYNYPWNRYNSLGQSTRYNAQNIVVFFI